MREAVFRFYAELNDFLPEKDRFRDIPLLFPSGQTVKHLIESCGPPHTEIDLILVNGQPVDFSYQVENKDRVSVFPVFESLDISSIEHLRPSPLRVTRFILDCHLGRLAAYLRLLGFDVLYRNDFEDVEIARISASERRICITRDRGLLKRNQITHGYLVRTEQPRAQVLEIVQRFDLRSQMNPFTRCSKCNGILSPASIEDVQAALQPGTLAHFDHFSCCESCGKVYWKGAHYQRLLNLIEYIRDGVESMTE